MCHSVLYISECWPACHSPSSRPWPCCLTEYSSTVCVFCIFQSGGQHVVPPAAPHGHAVHGDATRRLWIPTHGYVTSNLKILKYQPFMKYGWARYFVWNIKTYYSNEMSVVFDTCTTWLKMSCCELWSHIQSSK